jgi:hypothetical protein
MQSTDREQFATQIRTLLGAHGEFPSPDKVEAYWIGFGKLTLIQFGRLIEYALSEDGPDTMPTVPQLWSCWREMRRQGVNGHGTPDAPPAEKPVATIAETLCAYATLKLALSPVERARPWEYRYREWWVEGKRESELNAVHIERTKGGVTRITVADMLGDVEGHRKALATFARGAQPTSNALSKTGALVAPDARPALELSDLDHAVSAPEKQAAANFFDEPVTW